MKWASLNNCPNFQALCLSNSSGIFFSGKNKQNRSHLLRKWQAQVLERSQPFEAFAQALHSFVCYVSCARNSFISSRIYGLLAKSKEEAFQTNKFLQAFIDVFQRLFGNQFIPSRLFIDFWINSLTCKIQDSDLLKNEASSRLYW